MIQTLRDLFEHVNENTDEFDFKILVSYLEVYNEQVRDLLSLKLKKPLK